jgi:hypothetical protein
VFDNDADFMVSLGFMKVHVIIQLVNNYVFELLHVGSAKGVYMINLPKPMSYTTGVPTS